MFLPWFVGRISTTPEMVSKFEGLFPNSQLVDTKKDIRSVVTKYSLQYPWMDNCLMIPGALVVELILAWINLQF